MAPFVGGLESVKALPLGDLSTRQLSSVCERAAVEVVFDPKWRKRDKVRIARQREHERRVAERRVYQGLDPLHGARRTRDGASPKKKRNDEAPPKEEVVYSALTKDEIEVIARQRAQRDVKDAQRYSELRDLGLRSDASDADVERQEVANAYYEIGEMIFVGGAGKEVWALLPALHKKFLLLGTSDDRKAEIFDACHSRSAPELKKVVADHYDLTLDGTSMRRPAADVKRDRDALRARVEASVKAACRAALALLAEDERGLRSDIDKVQKRLVKVFRVKSTDLAVVPPWCQWTKHRGPAHGKPLAVQRAALRIQLDRAKRERRGRADQSKSQPAATFKHLASYEPSWATTSRGDDASASISAGETFGPRGYELERARAARNAAPRDKLPAIGNFGSPSKAPPVARDDPEDDLAAFVQRNGLEDFLSPEKEPRPR